jgi:hypothetical protein
VLKPFGSATVSNESAAFHLLRRCVAVAVCWGVVVAASRPARAQFDDNKPAQALGPQIDKPIVERIKIGMVISASGGPCRGIVGTAPVPTEWPEQQVKIDKEEVTPNIPKINYRTLAGGTVRQMIVTVPHLNPGEEASAMITFEVTRHAILPPTDPTKYKIPTHSDNEREFAQYLGPSPYIESHNDKIARLAKETCAGKENWEKVESIYDMVRSKLTYKEGVLKGALKGLNDGTGDCEEYSSLFIAMCRSQDIPARTVWVPGHCYSEFYMVDDKGKGYWFPCQSAGARAFGGIPETRPILQKGDNFHDPDRPHDKLRYVSEMLRGATIKGGGQPHVKFVREEVK